MDSNKKWNWSNFERERENGRQGKNFVRKWFRKLILKKVFFDHFPRNPFHFALENFVTGKKMSSFVRAFPTNSHIRFRNRKMDQNETKQKFRRRQMEHVNLKNVWFFQVRALLCRIAAKLVSFWLFFMTFVFICSSWSTRYERICRAITSLQAIPPEKVAYQRMTVLKMVWIQKNVRICF